MEEYLQKRVKYWKTKYASDGDIKSLVRMRECMIILKEAKKSDVDTGSFIGRSSSTGNDIRGDQFFSKGQRWMNTI
jgi:hypothetical protein